jgi:hypothetical protein
MSLGRTAQRRQERAERDVAPLDTCDKSGCEQLATSRAVLMLAPSRGEQSVPHPLGFVLCATHRRDWATAEQLLQELEGLWETIVEGLKPSGRVPVRELTRLEWEPCAPKYDGVQVDEVARRMVDAMHSVQRESPWCLICKTCGEDIARNGPKLTFADTNAPKACACCDAPLPPFVPSAGQIPGAAFTIGTVDGVSYWRSDLQTLRDQFARKTLTDELRKDEEPLQ